MTELEVRVWNYSRTMKIAKDNGDTAVVEFFAPLYRSAVRKLMREWDAGAEPKSDFA